jgi:transposase InsO family protein
MYDKNAYWMSRKGNCYDNSVMGNFFGYFKSKQLYLQEFDSTVLWMEQTGQTGYPARKTMERLRGKTHEVFESKQELEIF